MRSQIRAHWSAFDALAESQSGGNEAMVRALDVFESAAAAFKSVAASQESVENDPKGFTSGDPNVSAVGQGSSTVRANAGGGHDEGREAYLRAEQSLALAREQLAKNAETLQLMAQEVEGTRRCISSSYEAAPAATAQERKQTRASASLHALDRGDTGCLMAPVDMARAMGWLLRNHQSEFEMQETIVCSVGYDTSAQVIMAYRAALDLRPFMDDKYLEQLREIRHLSEEMESAATSDSSGKAAAGR